jgi:hypothetical protein
MSGPRTQSGATARIRVLARVLGVWGLSGVAWAQAPGATGPVGEPAAETGAEPAAPAEAPEDVPGFALEAAERTDVGVPWADDHQWVSAGLRRRVASLAALPGGVLVAVTDDGEVQRRDGKRGWRVVLSASGGLGSADDVEEEDMLLDAESAVMDFSEDDDDAIEDDGASDSDPDASADDADVEDATEDGEVEAGAGEAGLPQEVLEAGLLDAAERSAREAARRPGVWRTGERSLLLSRSDGAWRTNDGGQTWTPVPTLPPTLDIVPFPGFPTELVAATTAGVYQSGNAGASWFEVESTLSGDRVYDLASDERYVYAGTDRGLFRSLDGMRWERARQEAGAATPIFAIAADRSWEGGLWLAGVEGVLRSDDGGETMRPTGRNPLAGTRVLVALPGVGRVMAAGSDGVWESTDGGVRWRPVVDGLAGPDQRGLVLDAEAPFVGGAYGVYRLGRSVEDPDTPAPLSVDLPRLGELIGVSMRRGGVNYDPVLVQRGVLRALATPTLSTFARLEKDSYRTADLYELTAAQVDETDWSFGVTVCFGACAGWIGIVSDIELAEIEGVVPELVTVGDEVFDLNDVGTYSAAAANAVADMTKYRGFLANSLTELYHTRLRLEAQRGSVRVLPLQDQVVYALSVAETDAQIDAYTDGYYYRVLAARNAPDPDGSPSTE